MLLISSRFLVYAAALMALASPLSGRAADGATVRKDAIVLAAPKDLDAAVRAVEAATGTTGKALRDVSLKQARSFAVDAPTAERLLAGSHVAFRKAGLYLFRYERSYGLEGDKDHLGLMKTSDYRAVIRLMGTAGPKHEPSTEKVVAWLEALAKEEPFEIREVGVDYIYGHFEGRPKDPVALAKRCAELAPELVAGRASRLDLLANEIRDTGSLYLIW